MRRAKIVSQVINHGRSVCLNEKILKLKNLVNYEDLKFGTEISCKL
jgi:hypothetical protein